MPRVMPNGLCLPPTDEAERIMGNNGQIHGAKIVTNPAMKVKNSSISINLILVYPLSLVNVFFLYFTDFFLLRDGTHKDSIGGEPEETPRNTARGKDSQDTAINKLITAIAIIDLKFSNTAGRAILLGGRWLATGHLL